MYGKTYRGLAIHQFFTRQFVVSGDVLDLKNLNLGLTQIFQIDVHFTHSKYFISQLPFPFQLLLLLNACSIVILLL